MAENKKQSLFQKVLQWGEARIDQAILKARSDIALEEDDAIYRKSIYKDITNSLGSQGYQEKTNRLSYTYLQQMAKTNTIVASLIQTYQNKVAAYAKPAKDKHDTGFRIILKNEEKAIDELLKEMYPEKYGDEDKAPSSDKKDEHRQIATNPSDEIKEGENPARPELLDEVDTNSDGQMSDREMRRHAKAELQKRTREKRDAIMEMVLSCGSMNERPFESLRWDLDSLIRAWTRDSLTYDQISCELVPDNAGKLHHWVPVDGGTIRYAAPSLKNYKDIDFFQSGYDLLFPEKELKAMEAQRDSLELDEEKLENDDYKYVQVVRGRVVRAFTPEELFIGMRNPTTDLYANGYSVAELEVLLSMISAHIFTENYNKSYFTQGFSAKGVLHIKAPLNKRKLESVRTSWQHLVKGNRNSFQTPILSGMDEVKWIPLSQSHSDMEFTNWMNYLIKIICAIYQIDPAEIGFGMREEGGRGTGGLGGDNLEEKLKASRSKGLVPMLKFFETIINKHIIDRIDPDYKLEFVGISEESQEAALKRQEGEVKYKKSVNEIRAEDDLPPIPGADDLILDQVYFQWFTQFHPDGKRMMEQKMGDEQAGMVSQTIENDAAKKDEMAQQHMDNAEQAQAADAQSHVDQVSNVEEEMGAERQADREAKLQSKMKKAKTVEIEYYEIKE